MVLAQYSGNAEVFATIALKASDGFTKIYPVFIVIIGTQLHSGFSKSITSITCCHYLCNLVGLGITLVALASWFFWGKLGVTEIIGIFLIIVGIVVLKGFSSDLN